MDSAQRRTAPLFSEPENQPPLHEKCIMCGSKKASLLEYIPQCKSLSACKQRRRRTAKQRLIETTLAFYRCKIDLQTLMDACREYEGVMK